MKKLIIFFLVLVSCSHSNSLNINHQSFKNFNENLSYEEFYSLLVEYGKKKQYPSIKD